MSNAIISRPRATMDEHTSEFSSLEEKFYWLADKWLDSQSGRSRIDFSHPAHLQIVGMGAPAIPFLLREVAARSGQWFEALRAIVGSSPTPPESRCDMEAVRSAWLKWGSENGYDRVDEQAWRA